MNNSIACLVLCDQLTGYGSGIFSKNFISYQYHKYQRAPVCPLIDNFTATGRKLLPSCCFVQLSDYWLLPDRERGRNNKSAAS
jgi:hypothetical protein